METLQHFYSRILTWDNLIKRGYFNITKDKGIRNHVNVFDNPYAKYDSLFAGYFNLEGLVQNESVYKIVKDSVNNKNVNKLKSTTPIIYTTPKDENTRRPFKYPNFFSYCLLVNQLSSDETKDEIIKAFVNNEHSMSKFFGYSPYNFEVTHRMQDFILIGHSHFFKTDFSTFYPSFYTHALAWLIMGKKEAKTNHCTTFLGNRLDKLIELEQDSETHGIPTGNLVTNIVIEYAMTFFDEKLEKALKDTTVDFYRYVDDIYFGYNDPEDLIKIKKALQTLTVEYDLELNDKKVTEISYNEINRGSKLLNYFANLRLNHTIKIIQFLKLFNNYYATADEEFLAEVKGAKKLFCSSLQYFLNSLNKANQKNALKTLVKTTTEYELPFFFKIIQLVLDDTSVAERFIHLLEEIQKEERNLWPNDSSQRVVSEYCKNIFTKKPMNYRMNHILMTSLRQNHSEEAYLIFILMQKLDLNPSIEQSIEQLKIIFGLEKQDQKQNNIPKYLDNIDDFNWLMILKKILQIMDADNDSIYQNIYFKIINVFHSMLYTDHLGSYFETKHWLLKYELVYTYEIGNSNFRNYVDDFYSLKGNHNLINIFKLDTFDNVSASQINKFYINLLRNNYSFSG